MNEDRGLAFNGEWVYGWYVESESNKRAYIVTSATGYDESPTEIEHLQAHGKIYIHEYHRIDPKTRGRRIGIADKNQKDIYTGDKIQFMGKDNPYVVVYDEKYAKFRFKRGAYGEISIAATNSEWYEIVGSIHQDLKSQKSYFEKEQYYAIHI